MCPSPSCPVPVRTCEYEYYQALASVLKLLNPGYLGGGGGGGESMVHFAIGREKVQNPP